MKRPLDHVATIPGGLAVLAKLAQNAMKAQRISSANAVSALCERTVSVLFFTLWC